MIEYVNPFLLLTLLGTIYYAYYKYRRFFRVIRELKQTDTVVVNQQISIQKDSRPSEFTRPLTSFTL